MLAGLRELHHRLGAAPELLERLVETGLISAAEAPGEARPRHAHHTVWISSGDVSESAQAWLLAIRGTTTTYPSRTRARAVRAWLRSPRRSRPRAAPASPGTAGTASSRQARRQARARHRTQRSRRRRSHSSDGPQLFSAQLESTSAAARRSAPCSTASGKISSQGRPHLVLQDARRDLGLRAERRLEQDLVVDRADQLGLELGPGGEHVVDTAEREHLTIAHPP